MNTPEAPKPHQDLSKSELNWEVTPEAIEAMTEEELKRHLVEQNEKIRRLHKAVDMLSKGHYMSQHIDLIVNPERESDYSQMYQADIG